MKIGVDIDGVLIDTDTRAYLNFCRDQLGWQVSYEKYQQTHSWSEATGQTSPDAMGDAFNQFLLSVEGSQKPISGAHQALLNLSKQAEIYFITSRNGQLREITENYLAQQLADVKYHDLSLNNHHNKAARIVEHQVDYYIDDSFKEVSLVLENKDVDTVVIPFPAFHGAINWSSVKNDARVYWLPVWEQVKGEVIPLARQAEIHKQAWQEIEEFISKG